MRLPELIMIASFRQLYHARSRNAAALVVTALSVGVTRGPQNALSGSMSPPADADSVRRLHADCTRLKRAVARAVARAVRALASAGVTKR